MFSLFMNEKFNKNAKVEKLTKMFLSHGEEKGLIVKDPFLSCKVPTPERQSIYKNLSISKSNSNLLTYIYISKYQINLCVDIACLR